MLTLKQLKWATQHDWCESYDTFSGTVQVREIHRDIETRLYYTEYLTFDNIEDLCDWAGY